MEKLIDSDWYKEASNEDKAQTIKNYTNESRVQARVNMIERLTKDLSDAELGVKIKELVEAKIVTEQVYNAWAESTDRYK